MFITLLFTNTIGVEFTYLLVHICKYAVLTLLVLPECNINRL